MTDAAREEIIQRLEVIEAVYGQEALDYVSRRLDEVSVWVANDIIDSAIESWCRDNAYHSG